MVAPPIEPLNSPNQGAVPYILNSSAAVDFDIAALAKTLGAEGKVVTAV